MLGFRQLAVNRAFCRTAARWDTILPGDTSNLSIIGGSVANPSKTDWAKLYQTSIRFKEAAPWAWMKNEDLFAVEDPATGEIGYCSILGNGGQEFGLDIFMGDEGYAKYLRMMSDEPVSDDLTENIMTPLLSLLFSDRKDLQTQDINVIRSLGLQFRGRNAWPMFRSQRPGYAPWFLDKAETVFLAFAVEQALVVAAEVGGRHLDLYEGADDNLILTRRRRDGGWEEYWSKAPKPQGERPSTPPMISEALVRKMANKAGDWELDMFVLPAPIGPMSGRPYFPLCFFAMERSSGLVVANETSDPWIDLAGKRRTVIRILEEADPPPRSINVRSNEVKMILQPITSRLGIDLRLQATPTLQAFKRSLTEYLH